MDVVEQSLLSARCRSFQSLDSGMDERQCFTPHVKPLKSLEADALLQNGRTTKLNPLWQACSVLKHLQLPTPRSTDGLSRIAQSLGLPTQSMTTPRVIAPANHVEA